MASSPWLDAATLTSAALVAGVLLLPKVRSSETWRATVTPLASIIGSGFLVVGPILAREYDRHAPWVMLALCAVAYAFGAAVRANIRYLEPLQREGKLPRWTLRLERASAWMLTAAYVISVAYYLNLLGSFAVSLTPAPDRFYGRLVTTAALATICFVGLRSGLSKLESIEQGAVTAKMAIIGGMMVALGYHTIHMLQSPETARAPGPPHDGGSLAIAFGLVITVQGFETSRYLGAEHSATTRIHTMRLAQWVSTAIYIAYVTCLTLAFDIGSIESVNETAIIAVVGVVASVLPIMLVAGALAAQFSAAVADTAGCGGLLEELSRGRVRAAVGYAIVAAVGLSLTWTTNVFEIIAYGSRAFAAYYALQCAVAATMAWHRRAMAAFVAFAALTILAVAITCFGATVEG